MTRIEEAPLAYCYPAIPQIEIVVIFSPAVLLGSISKNFNMNFIRSDSSIKFILVYFPFLAMFAPPALTLTLLTIILRLLSHALPLRYVELELHALC